MEEYIQTGKLAASHGLEGEMVLIHSLGKKSSFKNIEAIFIEEHTGSYIPYFIEAVKIKNDAESLVKFEGVNSKEMATKLLQKKVWLLKNDFEKAVNTSSSLSLLGFAVFNEEKNIGTVNEVIEQPHQVLLQINFNSKEALIPLHEKTLIKIDRKKKEVYVTLPDGLLEIYL